MPRGPDVGARAAQSAKSEAIPRLNMRHGDANFKPARLPHWAKAVPPSKRSASRAIPRRTAPTGPSGGRVALLDRRASRGLKGARKFALQFD
jgi:hypothetical protein